MTASDDLRLLAERAHFVLEERHRRSSLETVEEVLVDISAKMLELETVRRRHRREADRLDVLDEMQAIELRRLLPALRDVETTLEELRRLREPLQQRRYELTA